MNTSKEDLLEALKKLLDIALHDGTFSITMSDLCEVVFKFTDDKKEK